MGEKIKKVDTSFEVPQASDIVPVSSKGFLDIQAAIE